MSDPRGRGPAPGGRGAPSLPDGYLRKGYFDENGYLRDELITTQARQLAESFVGIKLTSGQLRKFYGHARLAGLRAESGAPFESIRPAILEMDPLAADAVGRAFATGAADYRLFRTFIERNVAEASKGAKEFREGFLKHFMYVVAYFTYFERSRS